MADKNLKRHLDATEAEIEALTLRLGKFLRTQVAQVIAQIKAGQGPIEAAAVLGSLRSALEDAGLQAEIDALEKPYARQLEYIKDTFKAVGVDDVFSDLDKDVIGALIKFDTDSMAARIGAHVEDVKSTLYASVLGGNLDALNSYVTDSTDSLESSLYTELNTMTQGFAQSVTMAKAQELGFELYEYIGPEDSLTRDFCDELLAKDPPIYTIEEIQSMDNGQGLDVSVYGGGYNCRHQWRPISEERARELGWDG